MCGIFGLVIDRTIDLNSQQILNTVNELAVLSQARGKESAGIAIYQPNRICVFKRPVAAKKMVELSEYKELMKTELNDVSVRDRHLPLAIIGHARLMTNGRQGIKENNQPIIKNGIVGIHNGIVVNDAALWERHSEIKRTADVDTELFMALLGLYIEKTGSVVNAVQKVYAEIYGTASTAVFFDDVKSLLLATNTGSLYLCISLNGKGLIFASERKFLTDLLKKHKYLSQTFDASNIQQLKAGNALLVNLVTFELSPFLISEETKQQTNQSSSSRKDEILSESLTKVEICDFDQLSENTRNNLRRCTKCILPETMPMISFDNMGVCNFCHEHTRMKLNGREKLEELVSPYRSKNGEPDCVVGLSGGRDSCYALHYLKEELGMNPVAYTYDWALVTDLGRRNQARMCGKLGIEHIIVAADIKEKRNNIRYNMNAWLKNPDLGMVPLFMAGDKFYFYHMNQIRNQLGLKLAFIGGNRLEKTSFKTGFCGVTNESTWRLYDVGILKKMQLAKYYALQFLSNPGYINRSLFDTIRAFKVSYFMKHDFEWLYDYILWDEDLINDTLINTYDWETAADTESTWRIGDGTTAFYNYVYNTIAGFSENDTFRSNQVREGMISREKAMAIATEDNEPRYDSIEEYAHLIGFDFDEAMRAINTTPKLY